MSDTSKGHAHLGRARAHTRMKLALVHQDPPGDESLWCRGGTKRHRRTYQHIPQQAVLSISTRWVSDEKSIGTGESISFVAALARVLAIFS